MAKSQYNADSAPLPPLSLRSGMPGSRQTDAVEIVSFPALPANDALPMPAAYILAGGASSYVGESAHLGRRLPAHGAFEAQADLSGAFPPTSSID
jgi:hypothetical protein